MERKLVGGMDEEWMYLEEAVTACARDARGLRRLGKRKRKGSGCCKDPKEVEGIRICLTEKIL